MGLVIDNFAGGGGASTGLEAAFGRPVDVAINHDEAAIAVHEANHPSTKHYCQSIYSVDPDDAADGKPVMLAWFSPDCKHHSKAKGGKPREKNIRDMAWVVPQWIERLQKTRGGRSAPRVIMLENVEEFRHWGPLDDKGVPIPERRGEEFKLWVRRIKKLGYNVEYRELKACDYGTPTSRKRLFLVARCDGLPIVWPQPTHGPSDHTDVISGKLLPYRTAAECIDWSIPCPSIFGRKKNLQPATCKRIAAGVMRYVVNAAQPFIVPVTHTGGSSRVHGIDEPLRTVTTARGGEFTFVSPTLVNTANSKTTGRGPNVWPIEEPVRTITTAPGFAPAAASLIKMRNNADAADPVAPLGTITSGGGHHGIAGVSLATVGYGEKKGQKPRTADIEEPLNTVVAGGGKHAVTSAFLHKYRQNSSGKSIDEPLPTVTANSFQKRAGGAPPMAVTSAHLEQANTGVIGHDAREPVSTVTQAGSQQRLVETTLIEADALPEELMDSAVRVAAFLIKYYGAEKGQHQAADQPLDAATSKGRFAVVTVTIDAQTFVLVDIGLRMLTPRELANAQGFPPDYILDPECWYKTERGNRKFGKLPIYHQIAKIGNAVCPQMSEALVRANLPEMCERKQAA